MLQLTVGVLCQGAGEAASAVGSEMVRPRGGGISMLGPPKYPCRSTGSASLNGGASRAGLWTGVLGKKLHPRDEAAYGVAPAGPATLGRCTDGELIPKAEGVPSVSPAANRVGAIKDRVPQGDGVTGERSDGSLYGARSKQPI